MNLNLARSLALTAARPEPKPLARVAGGKRGGLAVFSTPLSTKPTVERLTFFLVCSGGGAEEEEKYSVPSTQTFQNLL